MNWKMLFSTARTSIFSPGLVMNEVIGAVMVWGAYLIASSLLSDPGAQASAPAWVVALIYSLFWPTVVVSAICMSIASFKSALPAALGLLMILPLYLLGYAAEAKAGVFIALAASLLYVIGFKLHGGSPRVVKHS